MSKDAALEEFLRQYLEPVVVPRKKAAEIMVMPLPAFLGPRLDRSRNGRKRWTTRLDRRPDLQRFTGNYPM